MFFYLDAHFHFQFLGLANIVWDALQIITYFATSKVSVVVVVVVVVVVFIYLIIMYLVYVRD